MHSDTLHPHIVKVVGVGGAGCAVLRHTGIENCVFIDTHATIDNTTPSMRSIIIGGERCNGAGTHGDFDAGRQSALDDEDIIADALLGAGTVLIVSAFGGGTGTGATSIVANIAHKQGAKVYGIVITPFEWEGYHRYLTARKGRLSLAISGCRFIKIKLDNMGKEIRNETIKNVFNIIDRDISKLVGIIHSNLTKRDQLTNGIIELFKDIRVIKLGVGYSDKCDDRAAVAMNNVLENFINNGGNFDNNILVGICCADLTLAEIRTISYKVRNPFPSDLNLSLCTDTDCADDGSISVLIAG